MASGLLYEPRAFWSVARVETSATQPRPPFTVRLPREHFMNGEKYPVTITKVLAAPVNYQFNTFFAPLAPPSAANFRNDGVSAVTFPRIVIGAPQRQYYLRQPGHPQGITPRPSYIPNPSGTAFGTPSGVSSVWGISRWAFDKPMVIPKLGDLEFDLSSFLSLPAVGVLDQSAWVHFEETQAGLFNGNSRDGQVPVRRYALTSQPPFQPDGFGFSGQGQTATWPRESRFSARRYGAENPTSNGSIPVAGFTVMVDQIQQDDEILASPFFTPGCEVAPLAFRLAARARMRNGGTGAYWWREGAPLALVCPTITPAQVYDLPEPITLGPGDRLDVEVSTPGPTLVNGQSVDSIYQIGLSLCGYASIEA